MEGQVTTAGTGPLSLHYFYLPNFEDEVKRETSIASLKLCDFSHRGVEKMWGREGDSGET
jgi:hypothetical protein